MKLSWIDEKYLIVSKENASSSYQTHTVNKAEDLMFPYLPPTSSQGTDSPMLIFIQMTKGMHFNLNFGKKERKISEVLYWQTTAAFHVDWCQALCSIAEFGIREPNLERQSQSVRKNLDYGIKEDRVQILVFLTSYWKQVTFMSPDFLIYQVNLYSGIYLKVSTTFIWNVNYSNEIVHTKFLAHSRQ